jgi:hypothetical protein
MSVSALLPIIHDYLEKNGFPATAERLKKECGKTLARPTDSLVAIYNAYAATRYDSFV